MTVTNRRMSLEIISYPVKEAAPVRSFELKYNCSIYCIKHIEMTQQVVFNNILSGGK
jgi:hypothetical protein